jgi:hypothetical protein
VKHKYWDQNCHWTQIRITIKKPVKIVVIIFNRFNFNYWICLFAIEPKIDGFFLSGLNNMCLSTNGFQWDLFQCTSSSNTNKKRKNFKLIYICFQLFCCCWIPMISFCCCSLMIRLILNGLSPQSIFRCNCCLNFWSFNKQTI